VILTAATETAEAGVPWWVGPAVAITVAVLGALGLIITRIVRGPVEIKDLWAENRLLRADVDLLMKERKVQQTFNRIVGKGYDALSNVVERMTEETGIQPKYQGTEHDDIARARALLLDLDRIQQDSEAAAS